MGARGIAWALKPSRAESTSPLALRRLEVQGKVQLPPPRQRAKPSARRQLVDDQEPLPALPKLPAHAGKIAGLRMRLIENEKDPGHRIWNRLICLSRFLIRPALRCQALALDMIVASRVLLLSRLGKEHPDLPAELFYSPEELAVLVGFWGRKGDGHPGAKLLAEGLQVLQTLVWYKRALDQAASEPRRPRKSPT